jgi:nucleoside-diphosphate-sugar epimerase
VTGPASVNSAIPPSLVVGAAGFVGRHLVARLKSLGNEVRAVSLSGGFDLLREDLPLEGIGHVFHLAARTGVAEASAKPLTFLETNTYGTARIVEQCRNHGCSLTFLSSFRPGAEAALNPYVLSKTLAEQVCAFYAQRYGLRVVTLKFTNLYGPGQSPAFLIPHIVSQLLDPKAQEIVVQDLTPRRDYLHIDDALDAIVRSVGAPAGAAVDVGSGVAHSVDDVIRLARDAAALQKRYRATGAGRTNEVGRTQADIRDARMILGWEPRISLESGLLSMIKGARG